MDFGQNLPLQRCWDHNSWSIQYQVVVNCKETSVLPEGFDFNRNVPFFWPAIAAVVEQG